MSEGVVKAVEVLDAALQKHLSKALNAHEEEDGAAFAPSADKLYALQKQPRLGVNVYIQTVFIKVGEIDTINENFSANVFIQAKWREPRLDNYAEADVDSIDWTKMWNPKLYIENLVGDPKQSIWHRVTFDDRGQATAYEKRRLKGTFTESMELDQFPFDTQALTVSVASELLEEEVCLEQDHSEVSAVNKQSFVDEQEWNLLSDVKVERKTLASQFSNIRRKPIISSSCSAKRRPGYFIWNVLLVMFFICSLAFATFSVSIAKPHFRLNLSFTLVLTTITFKISTSKSLPMISYLTLLDKYILTSMGILCSICAWHAIVPIIMVSLLSTATNTTLSQIAKSNFDVGAIDAGNLQLTLDLDRYAMIVFVCVFILFHIIFFTFIIVQSQSRKATYDQKDDQNTERLGPDQKLTLESEDEKVKRSNKTKVA